MLFSRLLQPYTCFVGPPTHQRLDADVGLASVSTLSPANMHFATTVRKSEIDRIDWSRGTAIPSRD